MPLDPFRHHFRQTGAQTDTPQTEAHAEIQAAAQANGTLTFPWADAEEAAPVDENTPLIEVLADEHQGHVFLVVR